jgi:diguanylate cyclase (GGDEF)-like protein
MSPHKTRIRIENELLGRLEKRASEEEQANHLMSLLMDNYPLLSAAVLAEEGGKSPVVLAQRGLSGNFIKELYAKGTVPLLKSALSGEVVLQGGDSRLSEPAWRFEHEGKSLFAAPCRFHGETLGVFLADSGKADLFRSETAEAFRLYARLCAILLALRSFRQKISRLPDVDSVTGLHNFKFFHEVLHQELTRGGKFGHPVSLLFLRIRNLRRMNEVYGHVAADFALAELAGIVRSQLRDVDYAARSGSVIYVVIPQAGKGDAARAAERIVEAMNASPTGRGEVLLKAAIGVASYPKDGETERVLIPHVEAMVHESARKGENAITVFKD